MRVPELRIVMQHSMLCPIGHESGTVISISSSSCEFVRVGVAAFAAAACDVGHGETMLIKIKLAHIQNVKNLLSGIRT